MKSENEISKEIVDAALKIHRQFGPGLLESVYEALLGRELELRQLSVQRQSVIPIEYEGLKLSEAFRADLIVEKKVLVELKSVEKLMPVHGKQVLTYLRLADLKLGLLVNFGEAYLRDGITRVVNGLP
ncbi:MAG: GxxExxY protein [Nevskiales bacterium]|nr:GxxExxY protein [Nevskiales bacterium]